MIVPGATFRLERNNKRKTLWIFLPLIMVLLSPVVIVDLLYAGQFLSIQQKEQCCHGNAFLNGTECCVQYFQDCQVFCLPAQTCLTNQAIGTIFCVVISFATFGMGLCFHNKVENVYLLLSSIFSLICMSVNIFIVVHWS
jgi:hypothetical protein